jgi:hypothetical protein
MKRSLCVACLVAFFPAVATAANGRIERSLLELEPMTRMEQVCAIETMARVNKDKNPYRPDRAMINALSDPVLKGDTVSGNGGAFRSKGAWYQYSFTCTMAADHLSVSAFSYKVGEPIPEDRWETYGLY